MNKENNIEKMLSLKKGDMLVCTDNQTNSRGTKQGSVYVFENYDDSLVPINQKNAIMTWYPDGPIWSPEEYELIKYQFMTIKLEGVEKHQWLKDFIIL